MSGSGGHESAAQDPRLPDEAYRRMALLLRAGLVASLSLLAAATLAYWSSHRTLAAGSAVASNPILRLLSLGTLGAALGSGDPSAYLTLGLLVLVATPILRVASGFYYFERGGERTMAAITLVVLGMLFLGLLVLGPYVR